MIFLNDGGKKKQKLKEIDRYFKIQIEFGAWFLLFCF